MNITAKTLTQMSMLNLLAFAIREFPLLTLLERQEKP